MIDLILKPYCQQCNNFKVCTHESITTIGDKNYILTCANITICENIELTIRKEEALRKFPGPFDD